MQHVNDSSRMTVVMVMTMVFIALVRIYFAVFQPVLYNVRFVDSCF